MGAIDGLFSNKNEKYPCLFNVNDELRLTLDNLKQGMPIRVEIEPGELKGGLNVIRLRNLSVREDVIGTCWLQFDYYSLTCKRPALGSTFVVR